MKTFNLIGHSCPSERYPSTVLPVGILQDGRKVVFYQGAVDPARRIEVISDQHIFTVYSDRHRAVLADFDPEIHRLFAYSENNVVYFSQGGEAEFFSELLDTSGLDEVEPFVRLAFARLTGQAKHVFREIAACVVSLRETPEFLNSWVNKEVEDLLKAQDDEGLVESFTGRKILLIEDHQPTAQAMQFHFQSSNYLVILAPDGLAGLAAAVKQVPDLIILDLHMPYFDGYEVLRRLNEFEETRDIPVIVWSNFGEEWRQSAEFPQVVIVEDIEELDVEVRRAFVEKPNYDLLDRLVEQMVA